MRVLIAGATGVICKSLVPKLHAAGHDVTALASSTASAASLSAVGVPAIVMDVFDEAALTQKVREARPEVVVNELTRIPPRINPRTADRDLAPTSRLRQEASITLANAARAAGARRIVAQSVAFAYRPRPGNAWAESDDLFVDAPRGFRGMIEAIAALERATMCTPGLEGVVLRYGYLYGAGTIYARDGAFAADVRSRKIPLIGSGSGVFSFIHVEDAAEATVRAIDGVAGVYNIVDETPVAVQEWLPAYAAMLGARAPMRVPGWLGRWFGGPYAEYLMLDQQGAANTLAGERLGWHPRHRSWRDGFAAMLAT